ncbi:flagellar assembly protein FliW [Paenibacillus mendelii]|uniref:Flagellar assembly factor FliW n=1 Tax=Paenibacillus mendelii TaxID=206163 RepID=A0ABV6J4J2_9BACL|nr:flagellar assembly protein FliW [Paenibacillus mendelii]MCQ6563560.1 flagellar assembly protein FliW [Paenibacillus mendelii]
MKMVIQTTRFGELEFDEQEIIRFPQGLPGFKQYEKYTVIPIEDSPFYYIQSVDEGGLAFVAVSPFDFYPEYEFELREDALQDLGFPSIEEVRVLNIVTVKDELEKATVNLIAPIVWNAVTRTALQVILQDSDYKTKHPLMKVSPDRQKGAL